jgi:hypothetical protein
MEAAQTYLSLALQPSSPNNPLSIDYHGELLLTSVSPHHARMGSLHAAISQSDYLCGTQKDLKINQLFN